MYRHRSGINLRKVGRDDLEQLLDLKEESWWGTHGTPILNMEDQVRWYESIGHNELYMIAEMEERPISDTITVPVGVACYTDIDWVGGTLSISGSIFKNFRLDNYVKPAFEAGLDFAFEVLNAQRVQAEVLESHIAAQKLEIDFLGFKVEGVRRNAVYKSGRYYNSLMLGMLRGEWTHSYRVCEFTRTGGCNLDCNHVQMLEGVKLSRQLNQVPGEEPEV